MDSPDVMVEGATHDQGEPTSPPGECYLLSASWADRGGKPAGGALVGVFPTPDEARDAILGWTAQSLGRHRAVALMKANRLSASMRVLEPSDLEEMAALVRQHRAAKAAEA